MITISFDKSRDWSDVDEIKIKKRVERAIKIILNESSSDIKHHVTILDVNRAEKKRCARLFDDVLFLGGYRQSLPDQCITIQIDDVRESDRLRILCK